MLYAGLDLSRHRLDVHLMNQAGGPVQVTTARQMGTYLHAQYHRLRGRRGPGKATMAVAHSVLVIAQGSVKVAIRRIRPRPASRASATWRR